MKKIILTILVSASLLAHATTPELSMYKSVEKKHFKIQSVTESRKFGKLIAASGCFIFLGGVIQAVSTAQQAPKFDISNPDEYEKSYKKWQKTQSNYRLGSASLFTVGGLCLLFAGDDLLTHKIAENKTASLKLKASTSKVGLCLNFK